MTRPVCSLPAGNGGSPPQGNVQTGAQRISREEYLKTIKAEIVSTLGSHPRGATLTVVGGAFKEDFGEEPREVARNLGYATFERLLQSEEFSDIVRWEITAGTGTGSGTGFCYKAKSTERIEHIMRDMEASEQSREEHERAEEAKKRAMLEHPQNDERVLQGKERILIILDLLGAHEEAAPLTDLQDEYRVKYDVVFGAEELKKYFGKASPKKVFLNFMHQEVDLLQDANHGGQLYLKMKKPAQDFLAEYARIREEAKKPKEVVPYRPKPFTAERNFNGHRDGASNGYSNSAPRGLCLLNGANGSGYTAAGTADRGRKNGFQPNHFRKDGGREGFLPQLSSSDTGNGSDRGTGFGVRSTNNQRPVPMPGSALVPANPPFSTATNNGSAQSTGFGTRSINNQNAKPGHALVPVKPPFANGTESGPGPVQSRFANGSSHPNGSDSSTGFKQLQHTADHKGIQDDPHSVQQPRNGAVRGFGVRKPAAAAFGARSPRSLGVGNDDAAAVRGFGSARNGTDAFDAPDAKMPWSRENADGVGREPEPSEFGTGRYANGTSESAHAANAGSGVRGFGTAAKRNVSVQQHAAPQAVPSVKLMPVQALPSMNSSSSENSTNHAQETGSLNLVPVPVGGLKNPYSSSDDESEVCAPAALPKPSTKVSTRKLPPNLVQVTAYGVQSNVPAASQLSPDTTRSSYNTADGDVALQTLQNNRERNKAPATKTKWTGRGNGVYTDVDDDSDDEDDPKELATVGGTTEGVDERQSAHTHTNKPHDAIGSNTSSSNIFHRKPQAGFVREAPNATSHAAKWLEMSAASAKNNRSKSVGAPLSRNRYAADGAAAGNEQAGHRSNGFPSSGNAPARAPASLRGFAAPQDSSRFRKTQKPAIQNGLDALPTVPKEKEDTHAMLCFHVHYLLTVRGRIAVSMLNDLLSIVCGREVSPVTEAGLNMSLEEYIRKFCSFAELIDDGAQEATIVMKMNALPPPPMELLRAVLGNTRTAPAN